MLPYSQNYNPIFSEYGVDFSIVLNIVSDFLSPKLTVACWLYKAFRAFMPEASINENC